jgi:Ca2+-binding EF-hand superfamily protein
MNIKNTLGQNANKKTDKKSEMLEVRLPYDDKRAFMAACEQADETASTVIRRAVALYTENRTFKDTSRSYSMILSGFLLGAITTTGLMLWANNTTGTSDRYINAYFTTLDDNNDNRIALSEYVVPSRLLLPKQPKTIHKNLYHTGTLNIEAATIRIQTTARITDTSGKYIEDHAAANKVSPNRIQNVFPSACKIALANMEVVLQSIKFKALDINSDDYLSLKEFSKSDFLPTFTMIKAKFDELDTDDSGMIEADEVGIYIKTVTSRLGPDETHHKLSIPPACKNQIKGKGALSLSRPVLELSDKITPLTGDKSVFSILDTNNNNAVTLNEFINYLLPR